MKETVRQKIKDNIKEWKKSGKSLDDRIKEARNNGLIAKKVFDDPKTMPKIIAAIDNEDKAAFSQACKGAGITDVEMITRMWDATIGSLDPQAARPCW